MKSPPKENNQVPRYIYIYVKTGIFIKQQKILTKNKTLTFVFQSMFVCVSVCVGGGHNTQVEMHGKRTFF